MSRPRGGNNVDLHLVGNFHRNTSRTPSVDAGLQGIGGDHTALLSDVGIDVGISVNIHCRIDHGTDAGFSGARYIAVLARLLVLTTPLGCSPSFTNRNADARRWMESRGWSALSHWACPIWGLILWRRIHDWPTASI